MSDIFACSPSLSDLPTELQLLIVNYVMQHAAADCYVYAGHHAIANVSQHLRLVWSGWASLSRSPALIPFPVQPITHEDLAACTGGRVESELLPPPPTLAAPLPYSWEVAEWLWSTFRVDSFQAIRAAQRHAVQHLSHEEEVMRELGEDLETADLDAEGEDVIWDEDFQHRIDEHNNVVNPDPTRWLGDAWGMLRRRPAVDGTRWLSVLPSFLQHPHPRAGTAHPFALGTLVFTSLPSMARYLAMPDAHRCVLPNITYLVVHFQDGLHDIHGDARYAYEAFESLVSVVNRGLLPRLHTLHLHACSSYTLTMQSPGLWTLLLLQGFTSVQLTGRSWRNFGLWQTVQQRLCASPPGVCARTAATWLPTELDAPLDPRWQKEVSQQSPAVQFAWLHAWYRRQHCRPIVDLHRARMRQRQSRTVRRKGWNGGKRRARVQGMRISWQRRRAYSIISTGYRV